MISIPIDCCNFCPFFERAYRNCGVPAQVRNGPDAPSAIVTQAVNPDGSLREVDNPRGPPPKWCPLRCSPAVVFLVPAEPK